MRVVILGGDGFCGWPTSLHFSARGHEVAIVDNFARRFADIELGVESLTPIRPLEERLEVWRQQSGQSISFVRLNVAKDYEALAHFFKTFNQTPSSTSRNSAPPLTPCVHRGTSAIPLTTISTPLIMCFAPWSSTVQKPI